MRISIIGTNGMLSIALTKYFSANSNNVVNVFGLEPPKGYKYTSFYQVNLLNEKINYEQLLTSDVIFYAAGAGVQAAIQTDATLMYTLNVNVPIEITLQLKKKGYKGKYISFGSYMEIGINNNEKHAFTEEEVVCSSLPVTNDYCLSKRLYSRYMQDFQAEYTHWHFILPNMFSKEDFKPGTRLIPYILQYIQQTKQGTNPPPPSFSAGTQLRQFIFLDEMVELLSQIINKSIPSGIYNIGGGEFFSIKDLIKRIFTFYNMDCKESYFGQSVRRDGDIKSLKLSGEKLFTALGILPSIKIENLLQNLKVH